VEFLVNIITPVGSLYGLEDTLTSVKKVQSNLNKVSLNHILVLNNSISLSKIREYEVNDPNNYSLIDINPAASRSTARNVGLQSICEIKNNSFVIFLDVGDELLYDAIHCLISHGENKKTKNAFFVCNSFVRFNQNSKLVRVPLYPINLRYIVNPFMIGGIILQSNLAKKVKFYEGKKEDWVYWNSILDLEPEILYLKNFNYIYNINNISEHYIKKIASIFQLRNVLTKQFNWGYLSSFPISGVHFIFIFFRWNYLRLVKIFSSEKYD